MNEQTGEVFHDMSDFKRQLRTIWDRARKGDHYRPREWISAHYGNEKAGVKLRQWIETEFRDWVDSGKILFPPGSRLLIPE